jgi:hypothetical protein
MFESMYNGLKIIEDLKQQVEIRKREIEIGMRNTWDTFFNFVYGSLCAKENLFTLLLKEGLIGKKIGKVKIYFPDNVGLFHSFSWNTHLIITFRRSSSLIKRKRRIKIKYRTS